MLNLELNLAPQPRREGTTRRRNSEYNAILWFQELLGFVLSPRFSGRLTANWRIGILYLRIIAT
jgi:hypothetical protein